MKPLYWCLLSITLLAGVAHAHQDRILTIRPDGSIPEIPPSFGRVNLKIKDLGTRTPVVHLKIGDRQVSLPACAAKFIRTKRMKEVQVTGSWYHNEARLPYYLNIEFYDPGYNPHRWANSSYRYLFNLRTAELIELTRHKANWFGNGGKFTKIDLPARCKVVITSMRSNNSFKPKPLRGSA